MMGGGTKLKLACWNLNNRVGRTTFRPLAAQAAMALDADIIVFTEFFPGQHLDAFQAELRSAGWIHQELSAPPPVRANRILIASRLPMEPIVLPPSTVDAHLASNALAVRVAGQLALLGFRVPTYTGPTLRTAWDWVAAVATRLQLDPRLPAVMVGDFNTSLQAKGSKRVPQFHQMLKAGWERAQPAGHGSFFAASGTTHEIDHVLWSGPCGVSAARYVTSVAGFQLAGSAQALSDHAALTFELGR